MLEVAADLVKSTSPGARLDEAAAIDCTACQVPAPRERIHTRTVFRLRDRVIDVDLLRRCASHERDVPLVDFGRAEGRTQDPRDLRTQPKQQHTAGRAVQTVHWINVTAGLPARPDQRGGFRPRDPARMHREPGRFVHRKHVCVEVQERRCGRHMVTVSAPPRGA